MVKNIKNIIKILVILAALLIIVALISSIANTKNENGEKKSGIIEIIGGVINNGTYPGTSGADNTNTTNDTYDNNEGGNNNKPQSQYTFYPYIKQLSETKYWSGVRISGLIPEQNYLINVQDSDSVKNDESTVLYQYDQNNYWCYRMFTEQGEENSYGEYVERLIGSYDVNTEVVLTSDINGEIILILRAGLGSNSLSGAQYMSNNFVSHSLNKITIAPASRDVSIPFDKMDETLNLASETVG